VPAFVIRTKPVVSVSLSRDEESPTRWIDTAVTALFAEAM
jgi:hypothetical protein